MRNVAKWRCQLTEYDIEYVSRTSVKGQAIADHLAEFPIEDDTPINSDFPDERILQVSDEEVTLGWKMYFDSAVNSIRSDALATLASMVSITKENLIEPLEFQIAQGPAHCNVIDAVDGKPWYADIKHLLQTGQFPAFTDRHDRRTLPRICGTLFLEWRDSLPPFIRRYTAS
ncbi:hypothetical protein CRG98_026428, partial [Punica granatum]